MPSKKSKSKTRVAKAKKAKAIAAKPAPVEALPVIAPVVPPPVPPAPILSDVKPHNWTHTGDEVLILRRVNKDRTAYGGFAYPAGVGSKVEPTRWDPSTSCGDGLHGWPWGFGLGEGKDYHVIDDLWLVIGAKPSDVVGELEGGLKCKCHHATIRYEGNFTGAMAFIRDGFHACIREMAKVIIPAGGSPSPTASDAYKAVLASSEWKAVLAASGDSAQLAASGDWARLAASGNSARLAASGDWARLAASGNSAQLAASGDWAQLAASGDWAQLAASGNSARLAASGDSARLAASGNSAQLAASGDWARLAASGNSAQLAASGDWARLAASGNSARLAASGDSARLEVNGENGAIAITGRNGYAKAGKNGTFALTYWVSEEIGYEILVGKVGRDGIEADVWYTVRDGKIVRA